MKLACLYPPTGNWHVPSGNLHVWYLHRYRRAYLCLPCKGWEYSVSDKMVLRAQVSGLILERHTPWDKYSTFIWWSVWPALIAMTFQKGSTNLHKLCIVLPVLPSSSNPPTTLPLPGSGTTSKCPQFAARNIRGHVADVGLKFKQFTRKFSPKKYAFWNMQNMFTPGRSTSPGFQV